MAAKVQDATVLDPPDAKPAAQTEQPSQPKLVVPLGRGSRGKTVFVRWAAERALSEGRNPVLADADRTNQELAGYFDGVVTPPSADELDMREWLAAFLEQQIEETFSAFLDLGGGDLILKTVAREMQLVRFLQQYGVQPVAVHFIGPELEDLAYLRDVEQNGVFAPPATVLVLNEAVVPASRPVKAAFEPVLTHAIFKAALERGAKPVWMPRLACIHEVNQRRMTFGAARDGQLKDNQKPIGPWNRQLVAMWLREMESNFAPVADWLP
jgi:hypothetical protein